MDIRNIVSYIEYLKSECRLNVSVHFSKEAFASLPHKLCAELFPYNSHDNPYCMAIKKNEHTKCIHSQRELRENCSPHVGICRTCFAGVLEYIYPVCKSKSVIGFVAVSGYTGENVRTELSSLLRHEPMPKQLCNALIPPLAIMLERLFEENISGCKDEYNQILQLLNEYHSSITVPELAKYIGRSVSHISHLFKTKCGISISSYCNNLKLSDAEKLLRETDIPITQLALDIGFCDTSYFIYLFKRKFGTTPLKYRKHFQK